MTTPVTEKMCKERHNNLDDKVDIISDNVNKIRILFSGNGKMGYAQKIDRMWEVHERKSKSSQGWMDWGFRLVIVTMLGIMMAHMGLK